MTLFSITCPGCGASLNPEPGNGSIRCEFCGRTFLRPSGPEAGIITEGAPFSVRRDGDTTSVLFPADLPTAKLLSRLSIGLFILCALVTTLFLAEQRRWAGPFGGVIILFPMTVFAWIRGRISRHTTYELHLGPTIAFIKRFSGEERLRQTLSGARACEVVKTRNGQYGPRYQIRITGSDGTILIGRHHSLDRDDALALKAAVEPFCSS